MIITHVKLQLITMMTEGVIFAFVGSGCWRFTVKFIVSQFQWSTLSDTDCYAIVRQTRML